MNSSMKCALITLLVCCAVALCTEVVAEAVPRGAGDVEIPSCSPGGCVTLPSPFYLADCSGEAVQQTEVCICHMPQKLLIQFNCTDNNVISPYTKFNEPLFNDGACVCESMDELQAVVCGMSPLSGARSLLHGHCMAGAV